MGLVAVVVIGLTADWQRIGQKYFDLDIAKSLFPDILTIAAKNTVVYTVSAFIGGVILGLSAALLRLSSIRPYRWVASVYIEIFRGLPALLTIIFVGFITPIALGIRFPELFGVPTAVASGLSHYLNLGIPVYDTPWAVILANVITAVCLVAVARKFLSYRRTQ